MPIDFNQLREFVEAIAKTGITDLTIKEGDFELNLRKELPSSSAYTVATSSPQPVIQQPVTPVTADITEVPSITEDAPPKTKTNNWVQITSPMVGTFYRAPSPGEPSFVEIGDRINKQQVVCIIEAMKLMNDIEAEVTGEVMEIVVENGEPVEYGQALMWVNP